MKRPVCLKATAIMISMAMVLSTAPAGVMADELDENMHEIVEETNFDTEHAEQTDAEAGNTETEEVSPAETDSEEAVVQDEEAAESDADKETADFADITYKEEAEPAIPSETEGEVTETVPEDGDVSDGKEDELAEDADIMLFMDIPDGLQKIDGKWAYYYNGEICTSYYGLAENEYGVYYVSGGYLDMTYCGLEPYIDGLYYVSNGRAATYLNGLVRTPEYGWLYLDNGILYYGDGYLDPEYGWNGSYMEGYYGLAKNQYGWFMIQNGEINFDFNGMAKNPYGWWHCTDGKVNQKYTGLSANDWGVWYVKNGKLDQSVTGMVYCYDNDFVLETYVDWDKEVHWVYVNKGKFANGYLTLDYNSSIPNQYYAFADLESAYSGLAKNNYGTWYISGGMLDTEFTGLVKTGSKDVVKKSSWVMIQKGKYNATFTGIAKNAYGSWYMKNGALQTSYTGNVTLNSRKYVIEKGKVNVAKTFTTYKERLAAVLADELYYLYGFRGIDVAYGYIQAATGSEAYPGNTYDINLGFDCRWDRDYTVATASARVEIDCITNTVKVLWIDNCTVWNTYEFQQIVRYASNNINVDKINSYRSTY